MFDIPVALFIFKRIEKSVKIIEAISKVKPQKLYIVSDAGRNTEEIDHVEKCRRAVEDSINWECDIVKMYSEVNQGCHNIGIAAMKIFAEEKYCIFLEDDNYPCDSFFEYCRTMLQRYDHDDRILWICGTNYMGDYSPQDGADYVFTQHMLPCGWASWSEKFNTYYEYDFQHLNEDTEKEVKKNYSSRRLYKYDLKNWKSELENKKNGRYASWDYHMNFSLRYHNKLGIAPRYNQITNIGVDEFSEHGGTSMDNYLTNKFCMIPVSNLEFPLKHPDTIHIDKRFERKTEKIIVPPRSYYMKIFLRRLIPIPRDVSIRKSIKTRKIVRKGDI